MNRLPQAQPANTQRSWAARLRTPGLIAGGADNDPAGIATFAWAGSRAGAGQLWILLLTTPMLVAVQSICGILGAETGRGLAALIRARFGVWTSGLLSLAFLAGNLAALVADTRILSQALSLVTGLAQYYFPALIIFLCWHLLVFHNFRRLMGVLAILNLMLLFYIPAALLLHPRMLEILKGLFWPPWSLRQAGLTASLTTAAALLGSRFSPYMFYWQASAETEAYADVRLRAYTVSDISTGMVASNVIGGFIMLAGALGRYSHGGQIASVRQAAELLRPVAGGAAYLLFAIGIVGAGLIAVPVLAATSSYVAAETFAWRKGLEQRPWQAGKFYTMLSGILLLTGICAYLPLHTIRLTVWSQIFWGLLAPVLLGLMLFLERRRGDRRVRLSRAQRFWLWTAVGLSGAVAAAMLASLV